VTEKDKNQRWVVRRIQESENDKPDIINRLREKTKKKEKRGIL
jgi:hypothetical protein